MNKTRGTVTMVMLSAATGMGQEAVVEKLKSANARQLAKLLERFPGADGNEDGLLTAEEAVAFLKARMSEGRGSDEGEGVAPTHADIPYGPHERNVLDFWQAEGEGAKPLVVFVHGGGFTGGDKATWRKQGELRKLLERGVHCAAINYRFRESAPIQDILRDGARAVQYMRSRAREWGIDPARMAGWGASAGAGTSLWLGTRDDLADADSPDPVLRESSRLQAVVLRSTQATYDLTRWEAFLGPADPAWWSSPNEAAEFYHFGSMEDLKTASARPILAECDMLRWISAEDAPMFIDNKQSDSPPSSRGHYLHHPAHAREIERHCVEAGVECWWVQSVGEVKGTDPVAFVLGALTGGAASE